jgi:hypothetical protein
MGMDIEIEADIMKTLMQHAAISKHEKNAEDLRSKYIKSYYPETGTQVEELKKKVSEQIVRGGDRMRVSASVKETVNPALIKTLTN